MIRKLDGRKFSEAGMFELTRDTERTAVIPLKQSWGAFLLALVEAACIFVVAAGKAGIALSSISAGAAASLVFVHQNSFRIPALFLAVAGSLFNLFLLWRFHRLRNAPAAAWRKRPLTSSQRWRIGLALALSLLTILTAGTEIYFHRLLHHTNL